MKHATWDDERAAEGRSLRRVTPSRGKGLGEGGCASLSNLYNLFEFHVVIVAFYADILAKLPYYLSVDELDN